jgi:hypothetical protein
LVRQAEVREMTSRDYVSGNLLALLQQDHGDGGYALVGEVLAYTERQNEVDRQAVCNDLLRIVGARTEKIWGVALEVLTQRWGSDISKQLAALLEANSHGSEWEGQVLLSLLRLRYKPISERSVSYITRQLNIGDDTVLPVLAALCKVDPGKCVQITTEFFVVQFRTGHFDKIEGYACSFVRHFLDADPNLISLLVFEVAKTDKQAASRIATSFREFIRRPYMAAQLGEAQSISLCHGIEEACNANCRQP